MPVYRGNTGRTRRTYRIPSTSGLKAPGPLVTDAHSGVLINQSDAVKQDGYWVHKRYAYGSRDKPENAR